MFPARENPFAVERVLRIRYRFAASDWEAFLARLAALKNRGALVGGEGAGKTTLLDNLASHLAGTGWCVVRVQIHRGERRLSAEVLQKLAPCGPTHFVLLDGAEQLGYFTWQRVKWLTRRCGGFVITLHRAGRLPTLHECANLPEMFRHCLSELGVDTRVSAELQQELFARHRGNIRDCLRSLYDLYANGGWSTLERHP